MKNNRAKEPEPAPRRSTRKRRVDGETSFEFKRRKVMHSEIYDSCSKLIDLLMKEKVAWPFLEPVDPVALKIPNYFDIIKQPMDFGTIKNKLVSGFYTAGEEFAKDVKLVFSNAYLYNRPQDQIVAWAKHLETLFLRHWRPVEARETSMREREEVEQMKDVIDSLRNEHQKLVQELEKLVKARTQASPPSTPASHPPPSHPPTTLPTTAAAATNPLTSTPAATSTPAPTLPSMTTNTSSTTTVEKERTPKPSRKASPPKLTVPEVYDRKAKEILSLKINSLNTDELQRVVSIVMEEIGDEEKDSEFVIDLELLTNKTLAKLWEFADNCLAKRNVPPTPDHLPEGHKVNAGSDSESSDED